jgi:protein tyrosine kinase modulator
MTRELGMARLIGVVKRRRWPVVVTTLLVAATGLAAVKFMPPIWQARAVVRIDDPKPAHDYVAPIVPEQELERLKSARLAFLALPVVETAAEKVSMLSPRLTDLGRRQALGGISQRLDARLDGTDTFVLTYEDTDPALARAFLAALTEAFSARRGDELAVRAKATAEFFDHQVEALRPRVADMEAQVEKFRLSHYGSLPEQLDSNLRVLDETQMQAHTSAASLDMAWGRRREIMAEAQSPLRHQEEDVAKNVSVARTKYAADAPEIKNLEGELERVRAERVADEDAAARKIKAGAELHTVDDQIGRFQNQLDELKGRTTELKGRIDQAAKNGEQLARMSLDRDVLRDRLKSLVAKQEEARLAASMVAGPEGQARIAVVEPAWVLGNPVKPSKPLFGLLAVLAALAVGLGVGFLLDTLDRRVRATEEVRDLLGDVPLFGVIPRIDRPGRNLGKAVSNELV